MASDRQTTSCIAVIGLDAATFQVIEPLIQAGALPHLERLMARGCWGRLSSILHPLSPTAWASFMTGMNPGKHGVFDFIGQGRDGRFRMINGAAVGAETLWARLSRAGRRVGVVNVPLTYPPQPVNGFLIAGMDAPRLDRAFTHPPNLADELRARFGRYRVGVRARGLPWISVERFTARYVERLCDMARQRGEVVRYLLERQPLDFLMVVFIAPDRAQHALGHLLAQGISPQDGIGRVYRACDEAMGRILEALGEDWTVLVMSDHGAQPYRYVFEPNAWLAARGWLRLRPQTWRARLEEALDPFLRRLIPRPSRLARFLGQIVWEETRAFALGAFGSIFVNRRDRFPRGIVAPGAEYERVCEQIATGLLALRDPRTGAPIVRAVHRSSEVYRGPYTALAPDLLLETTEDYFVRSNLDQREGHLVYPAGRYGGRSLAHTGKHTSQGILIAAGEPFAAGGERGGARIIDLAPTILYLSGLPVPSQMDGQPLLEWLKPAYRQAHPVTWADEGEVEVARGGPAYTAQEAACIEAHLRDLGYVD